MRVRTTGMQIRDHPSPLPYMLIFFSCHYAITRSIKKRKRKKLGPCLFNARSDIVEQSHSNCVRLHGRSSIMDLWNNRDRPGLCTYTISMNQHPPLAVPPLKEGSGPLASTPLVPSLSKKFHRRKKNLAASLIINNNNSPIHPHSALGAPLRRADAR
ncbi:hypothetical protein CPB84DRAFT_260093 [Gymnopilus junonius]|uniref:Uncharacterized protein n=1 Tax=Gymnopilus junonius TaxID=109634 RepID=A0A9P5NEY6_GYMJU|nr:hypothetical protein CPB84DRAFT_260093 [Gymnopilus junonius]